MTGVASVKARQQSIVSSQSALDATKAGYDVGTRDLVDLLRASRISFAPSAIMPMRCTRMWWVA